MQEIKLTDSDSSLVKKETQHTAVKVTHAGYKN